MNLPAPFAILQRRTQQYRMILGMGGSQWNALRMFFTGRSGKFVAKRRRFFRDNWPAA